ncbi:YccF domain-containing protein [Ferrimonas balearica]|uniref:YccF domain-containing protein n=1 Tax=Ferrimonas balearica TaxID=44012 RepID=UPI001C99729C|nr:YccF domain-containing protein [Ferrimonas balearica]MBY5992169.1 YccF domain-containing protein [Ferrimonas balearica]
MDLLRFIGNVLWLLWGGIAMALGWALVGVVMALSIIGIPFARSCFVIAKLSLWPFGRDIASRRVVNREEDIGTGALGTLGNVIWFIVAGFWLALGHLFFAITLICTIIGIPFGMQHVKLAMLTVAPIGYAVVDDVD